VAEGVPVSTDPGKLIETYRDMAERNPTDRYVLHWLLMAYLSQKAYVQGIHEFMKFTGADKTNDQAFMCLAVLYEKGGYHAEAIQTYQRVLELNPDEELVYLFLSTRLLMKGDFDRAFKVCKAGMERFPRAERLHFNAGYALAQLKQHDLAISEFQKEIEVNPASAEAYFNIDVIKKNKVQALKLSKPA
jgi:tetratricopeptide (TPR) repeat protein